MLAEKAEYPVKMMARLLEVSRSGFYSLLANVAPTDEWSHMRDAVERVWLESDRRFGARMVHAFLLPELGPVMLYRMRKCMHELGIRGVTPNAKKCTTIPDEGVPPKPYLVARLRGRGWHLPQRPWQPVHLEAAGVVGQGKRREALVRSHRQSPRQRGGRVLLCDPQERDVIPPLVCHARGGEVRCDSLHGVLLQLQEPPLDNRLQGAGRRDGRVLRALRERVVGAEGGVASGINLGFFVSEILT